MSEPNKYREWILETIDSLRSRKARPDLERICRMVRRRHGSDPDRTRTELEKLIQEQTVLKVSYKGSISYRNAAKVQRKSRKKSEFTAAGSSSADAPREQTKHDHLNNNGDSAHSFTDQEEGDEDSEPSPDLHAQTSASSPSKKLKPASSPSSGNGCLSCSATTSCAVGSGCKEEKASAARDKGLGQQEQGVGGCPSPGFAQSTGAHAGSEASGITPSKADAAGGEKQSDLSGADTQSKTYSGSVGSLSHQQTQKQTVPLKPKLRPAGGSAKTAGNNANSDLGDRLVASVRSLSERSLRGGSSAATRGHMKPLGLKEILGYLSSQEEKLSEEKLTRGKVKVVMEREVARGRLRRTRCGNITLPLRGMVLEEQMPKNSSSDRLAKSALQDKHTGEKPQLPALPENEPMETATEEDGREGNEEGEEEDDAQSSNEEGGISLEATTTKTGLIAKTREDTEIQRASEDEGPQDQKQGSKAMASGSSGMSGLDILPKLQTPPVQGPSLSQCNGAHLEERAVASDPLHMEAQVEAQSHTQRDDINHNSSGFNSLECKTEVGVSSCMLTPTASPRDSYLSEDRGSSNCSGGLMTSEGAKGSPMDWSVSDVVSYFTAAGFPEQAAAFRIQEIDGKSLLLMQRNDVLTGLSIRLGPALKIYERHVKVLQKTHFEDDEC
ncbi:sterile alpha motif domain-containing protein 1 [Odontesthes bonariensis]|uniref:sterile alpha motif domain-containing protein 1 n=1 Tax=Odontesthes bonariensis TaxID=219752 RepID=UPI003F580EA9